MSNQNGKPASIRSPSYPNMPLREAIEAVGKIESQYRTSSVDRTDAAKLIGYSSGTSGPANMALAALAGYGLVERAAKGEVRVTERARSILHPDNDREWRAALRAAALEPQLFRDLRERFSDVDIPPEDGVVTYLNRQSFNPSAIRWAARAFLQTMAYMEEVGASERHRRAAGTAPGSAASAGDEAPPRYGGEQVIDQERAQGQDRRWGSPRSPVGSDFDGSEDADAGTDLRFKLGKGVVVQIRSGKELGADDLEKLLALLAAQRDALKD